MSKIEIDCPPMCSRPDTVLKRVLNKTELKIEDFQIQSKSFGCWCFVLDKTKKDVYEKEYNKIVSLLKNEYENGNIRYASWELC